VFGPWCAVGIGTPDYMCPEMLTSQPPPRGVTYNPEAVDVWVGPAAGARGPSPRSVLQENLSPSI
jgi:hypothetical protein